MTTLYVISPTRTYTKVHQKNHQRLQYHAAVVSRRSCVTCLLSALLDARGLPHVRGWLLHCLCGTLC